MVYILNRERRKVAERVRALLKKQSPLLLQEAYFIEVASGLASLIRI